jgi:hypothetical protein
LQTHVVISGREKVEVRDPLVAKVEAGGDFFKQFWVGPPDRCEKKQKKGNNSEFGSNDLVGKNNFAVEDCFPAREDEG